MTIRLDRFDYMNFLEKVISVGRSETFYMQTMEIVEDPEFADTISFVAEKHCNQTYGKYGNQFPYLYHLLFVATRAALWKYVPVHDRQDAIKAALLHDIVEDTDVTLDDLKAMGYSDLVLNAVERLTKIEFLTYDENIDRIIQSDSLIAMKVKIADTECNAHFDYYNTSLTVEEERKLRGMFLKYMKAHNRLRDAYTDYIVRKD